MSDDKDSSEIFSTPKLNNNGDGDGFKNVSSRKRTPIPSSRKFNARVACDENMKLKLEQTLKDMQKINDAQPKLKKHSCVTKSMSVAEITPTKTKPKKKPIIKLDRDGDVMLSNVTLHATPRPLEWTSASSTSQEQRRCRRDWAVCTVYTRMLLSAWRRYKARLQSLTEISARQLSQLNQLELQVDFLKSMRHSESEKRNEALQECQRLKQKVENLEVANGGLIQETKRMQEELVTSQKISKQMKLDLRITSDQLIRTQEQVAKQKEEKIDVLKKLKFQEQEVFQRNSIISHLEDTVKISEMNLNNVEANYKNKEEELNEIQRQLDNEMKLNCSLKDKIDSLLDTKIELQTRSKNLEDELQSYIFNVEELKDENFSIRENLKEVAVELSTERKRKWLKITKELTLLSLSALQKIVEVTLPFYHKY